MHSPETFPFRPSRPGAEPLTVLLTDSGLGGLSVCAALAARIAGAATFQRVRLVFFNALPEEWRGYNRMNDTEEKARVFDGALLGMARLRPDVILIACNTLSVLYPHTRFSRAPAVPVVGIVDLGVRMIHAELLAQPGSQAILFGTPTTIDADAHRARLVGLGIEPGRIVPQGCDGLASEIEKGPGSRAVADLVRRFTREAVSRLPDPEAPVIAAFCCTHFNYSAALFREALARETGGRVTLVNPNVAMSGCLASEAFLAPPGGERVEVAVLSRVALGDREVAAMAEALQAVSPQVAEALVHYRFDPELFSY